MAGKVVTLLLAIGVTLLAGGVLLAVMVADTRDDASEPTSGQSLGVLFLCGLGAVLAWCAWLWLRQGHRRHAVAGSLGAVAVVFGASGLAAVALEREKPKRCEQVRADAPDFRDARREAVTQDPPTRAQLIADDLVRCRTLTGLSKPAVVRLLGRPEPGVHGRLDYYLGTERGYIGIDSETLVVRFDGRDRVRGLFIARD